MEDRPSLSPLKVPGASAGDQPPCQELCIHIIILGFIGEVEAQRGE